MITPLDVRLLKTLQSEAKLSMQALAERVHASTTQCWRRQKLLEDSKIIEGYHAQLSPKAIGLNATAFVQIALSGHDQTIIDQFQSLIAREDQVVECASITGEYDFMLLVHAADPEALERFIMRRLLNSGLVEKTQSYFVLRQTKTRGPLPLGHLEG